MKRLVFLPLCLLLAACQTSTENSLKTVDEADAKKLEEALDNGQAVVLGDVYYNAKYCPGSSITMINVATSKYRFISNGDVFSLGSDKDKAVVEPSTYRITRVSCGDSVVKLGGDWADVLLGTDKLKKALSPTFSVKGGEVLHIGDAPDQRGQKTNLDFQRKSHRHARSNFTRCKSEDERGFGKNRSAGSIHELIRSSTKNEKVSTMISSLFFFRGKIRRGEFFYCITFSIFVFYIFISIVRYFDLSPLFFWCVLPIFVWSLSVLQIKRFRDRSRSGWRYLVFLVLSVPYVTILAYSALFSVDLGFEGGRRCCSHLGKRLIDLLHNTGDRTASGGDVLVARRW